MHDADSRGIAGENTAPNLADYPRRTPAINTSPSSMGDVSLAAPRITMSVKALVTGYSAS